jgi:hypothetical protein
MLRKQEYEAPSEPLMLLNQVEMLRIQGFRRFVQRIMLLKCVYSEHNYGGQTENLGISEHPDAGKRLR